MKEAQDLVAPPPLFEEMLDVLLALGARRLEDLRPELADRGVAGVEAQHLGQLVRAVARGADREVEQREECVGADRLRVQLQRALEALDGAPRVAGEELAEVAGEVDLGAVEVRLRLVGELLEVARRDLLRRVPVPELEVQHDEVAVGALVLALVEDLFQLHEPLVGGGAAHVVDHVAQPPRGRELLEADLRDVQGLLVAARGDEPLGLGHERGEFTRAVGGGDAQSPEAGGDAGEALLDRGFLIVVATLRRVLEAGLELWRGCRRRR